MAGGRVLLEGVGTAAGGHGVHPWLHLLLQDLAVDVLVGLLSLPEKVGLHDVPIGEHDAQAHDDSWVLGLEDHGHISDVPADPPVVLAVPGLVHSEDILITEKPDVAAS